MNDKMITPDPVQVLDTTVEGGEPMHQTLSDEDFKKAMAALKAANVPSPYTAVQAPETV